MPPRVDKYGVPSRAFNVTMWVLLGIFLPVAYVWSLPAIAEFGVLNLFTARSGPSTAISGYISTAEGTGFMALTFLFPIIILWSEEAGRSNVVYASRTVKILYYSSLFLFTVSFGLFLALPTTTFPAGHQAATIIFAVAGAFHFLVIAFRDRMRVLELAVVFTGIPVFISVAIVSIVQSATGTLLPPYLYWALQSLSFTLAVLFTPLHVFAGKRTVHSAGLSEDRTAEMAALFASFDTDGSGLIEKEELRKALQDGGVDLSNKSAARASFDLWDADGDGKVTFPEFVDLIVAILRETAPLPVAPARAAKSSTDAKQAVSAASTAILVDNLRRFCCCGCVKSGLTA